METIGKLFNKNPESTRVSDAAIPSAPWETSCLHLQPYTKLQTLRRSPKPDET